MTSKLSIIAINPLGYFELEDFKLLKKSFIIFYDSNAVVKSWSSIKSLSWINS